MDKQDAEQVIFDLLDGTLDSDVTITKEFDLNEEDLPAASYDLTTSANVINRVSGTSIVERDDDGNAIKEIVSEERTGILTIQLVSISDDEVSNMKTEIHNELSQYEVDYNADPRDLHEDLHYIRVEEVENDVLTSTREFGQSRLIQSQIRFTRRMERDVDAIEDVVTEHSFTIEG